MKRLLAILLLACAVSTGSARSTGQAVEPAFETDFLRWRAAVEAHGELDVTFWYRDTVGPADLRNAVSTLLSHGPNLVPFLVDQIRRETDQRRLYQLVFLLRPVAGINLHFGSGLDEWSDVPVMKARFLADWDAGRYADAATFLRTTWKEPRLAADGSIDAKTLAPLLRYGVFAVPFIEAQLEKGDSPALFAAFLNVTRQYDVYRDFSVRPTKSFSTRGLKVAAVRRWARENGPKVDRLKGLREQISVIAAK
jgi:hypothetical protein